MIELLAALALASYWTEGDYPNVCKLRSLVRSETTGEVIGVACVPPDEEPGAKPDPIFKDEFEEVAPSCDSSSGTC